MRKYAVYLTVFFLSFCILSLQVILAILFEVFFFSPFFSISLAFLGLSTAGSFFYVKYFKKDILPSLKYVSLYFSIAGILLLLYPFVLRFTNIVSLGELKPALYIPWQQTLLGVFNNSLFIGAMFILLFFCLGMVGCLIYKHYSDRAQNLYFFDLIGGASGCIFSTIIFNFFQLSSVLLILAFLVFVFLGVVSLRINDFKIVKAFSWIFSFLTIILLIINIKTEYLEPKVNPHFLLSDWNMQQDCQEIWHRWNVYSRIALVKHKGPLDREYNYDFVINNGEGRASLVDFKETGLYSGVKSFDSFSPANLAFLSKTPEEILILFAGAGKDMIVANACSSGASFITGVELNPLIVNKAKATSMFHLEEFLRKDNISMVVDEGRTYLGRTNKLFDSIILANSVAGAKNYLGIPDYTGKFLYTKEAFVSYLQHLKSQGTIGIVSCNKINVIAMAKEAFKQLGYRDFSHKIIVFTASDQALEGELEQGFFSNNTTKVLIKNADFSEEEAIIIGRNITKMHQVLIYTPYYTNGKYHFFEKLIRADDTQCALKELSRKYHRNFFVPTDDRPFVDQLATFGDIINFKAPVQDSRATSSNSREGGSLFYTLIVKFNLFLFAYGAIFIFAPLVKLRKNINFRILLYFAILGLGFISVEIGIMQYFNLLLGNPVFSFSVILALLMLSSGLGSFVSQYLFDKGFLDIKKVSLLIFFVLFAYFLFLSKLINYFLSFNLPIKLLFTFCLICPLGLFLGMLYPQGLRKTYRYNKGIIPLALAINGFMSIVASALSPFFSWGFGFSSFLFIAGLLYLLIAFINFKF